MGEQAHVHREARVVAPAYIGRRAKVNAAGLVTRSSSLERDCEVGEATVVEDASILADTHLGRWLDVSHAVVDGNTFVDLRSEVAVEIADGALVGRTKASESRLWLGESEHLTFVKRVSGRVKKALLH
jgi:NDP-sugar pyrophosphorylase family protein